MDNNIFGERLKKIRETRKYSRTELAEKIGVSKTSLSAYESGTKKPSYEIVANLARACQTSMDWLCGFGECQDSSINNFGEFLKLFFKISKSKVLLVRRSNYLLPHTTTTSLDFHEAFNDFARSYIGILELYKTGTLEEEFFNIWFEHEIEKYKNTDIEEEIKNYRNPSRKNQENNLEENEKISAPKK